jgi:alanine racemase
LRPTAATIDLPALRHNLGVVRRRAPNSKVFAVIKANAYGHGLLRAARAFADADGLAVIEPDAAVRLREAGYTQRVLLLEGFFESRELPVLVQHRISTAVHSLEQIEMLAALPAGSALDVFLKVNTGMNRLGLQPRDVPAALERLQHHPGIAQITMMTHFANADDARGIAGQLAVFDAVAGRGLPRSLANSAAILRFSESHADWVRPGIILYGCSPLPASVAADLDLRPAMTLASEIIAVQELVPGDTVGYGSSFVAEEKTRIGVVACGYAWLSATCPYGYTGAGGW